MRDADPSGPDYHVEEFHVLRHKRRKWFILMLLLFPQDGVSARVLSQLVTVFTVGTPPRQVTTNDITNTQISITRGHQQVLEDAGVIEEDGTKIVPGPAFTKYCTLLLVQELVTRLFPVNTD